MSGPITYRIKIKGISGLIYVTFENGVCRSITFDLNTPLSIEQFRYLNAHLYSPENMEQLPIKSEKVSVQEIKAKSIKEKLIAFCAAYKSYRGTTYNADKLERANVKLVPVNEGLLAAFFGDELQNYTLSNYIKRINITKDKAAKRGRTVYPNTYNREYEKGLPDSEKPKYWQHLKRLGWVKQNINGRFIWKEERKDL